MTRLAAALCALLTATGCDSAIIVTTNPSGLSLATREIREISVGEHVGGRLHRHGAENVFELTARSDGFLVVRVSWSTPGRIELWLDGTLRSQASASPIVGRVAVVAGRRYQVRVADAAAWDYDDWSTSYTLTTTVE